MFHKCFKGVASATDPGLSCLVRTLIHLGKTVDIELLQHCFCWVFLEGNCNMDRSLIKLIIPID